MSEDSHQLSAFVHSIRSLKSYSLSFHFLIVLFLPASASRLTTTAVGLTPRLAYDRVVHTASGSFTLERRCLSVCPSVRKKRKTVVPAFLYIMKDHLP